MRFAISEPISSRIAGKLNLWKFSQRQETLPYSNDRGKEVWQRHPMTVPGQNIGRLVLVAVHWDLHDQSHAE